MYTKTRTKKVTEKEFEDRNDNFIIKTKETITKKLFGIVISKVENFEELESIPVEDKEIKQKKDKKIGFHK